MSPFAYRLAGDRRLDRRHRWKWVLKNARLEASGTIWIYLVWRCAACGREEFA